MTKSPEAFPWKEAMEFGFGVLKLAPKDFWQMTPRELNAAIKARTPKVAEPVTRDWLENAMKMQPDKKGDAAHEFN